MWAQASLQMSAAAKAQIIAMMNDLAHIHPIAYIGWVLDQVSGMGEAAVHLGPSWGVGFYSMDQVPRDAISLIDDIPFIFEAETSQRLNGAILDFANGVFVVREPGA